MRVVCLFLLSAFALTSCLNNTDTDTKKEVHPDNLFQDYKIRGEEGRDDINVMLQFRIGGEEGEAISLEEPSKVKLDTTELKPDSAKFTGTYYELVKPLNEFRGKHTITFTDRNQKEYKEEFRFEPFSLATELPDQLVKRPFIIQLTNFPDNPTKIHLAITDTSFDTKDVNEEIVVKGGEIKIGEQELANLSTGPITLEIIKEELKPLKNKTKKGGRILITYGLRRQFEFVD